MSLNPYSPPLASLTGQPAPAAQPRPQAKEGAAHAFVLAQVFRTDHFTLSDLWSDTIVIREPAHA